MGSPIGAGGWDPHPGALGDPGRAQPGEEVEGHPIGTPSYGEPLQARGSASRRRMRAWSRGCPAAAAPTGGGR